VVLLTTEGAVALSMTGVLAEALLVASTIGADTGFFVRDFSRVMVFSRVTAGSTCCCGNLLDLKSTCGSGTAIGLRGSALASLPLPPGTGSNSSSSLSMARPTVELGVPISVSWLSVVSRRVVGMAYAILSFSRSQAASTVSAESCDQAGNASTAKVSATGNVPKCRNTLFRNEKKLTVIMHQ